MKLLNTILLLTLLVLTAAVPAPQDASSGAVSIPSEQAEANRRGVAFNDEGLPHLFMGANNKIGWMYNWDSNLCGGAAHDHTGTWLEYMPMLHSDTPDHTGQWAGNVDHCAQWIGEGKGAFHILGFNEPDQCGEGKGGACMSMDRVLSGWYTYFSPLAGKYGDRLKLGSPAVTNGDDGTDGVGLRFLQTFLNRCNGCKIDFVNVHWYEGAHQIDYFKSFVQDALKVGNGRPVWITEFGLTSGSDAEKAAFLKDALPWLGAQKDVHRYAYQMAATGILVSGDGTGLSDLGNVYTYT